MCVVLKKCQYLCQKRRSNRYLCGKSTAKVRIYDYKTRYLHTLHWFPLSKLHASRSSDIFFSYKTTRVPVVDIKFRQKCPLLRNRRSWWIIRYRILRILFCTCQNYSYYKTVDIWTGKRDFTSNLHFSFGLLLKYRPVLVLPKLSWSMVDNNLLSSC